ncbi:MAG: hypothetical protein B7C24_10405 [Bacteroidetes bacterium 4572_77]|nr:MAG: hypothetical protein B7C24_10405 [Bacteroidetes bacterium 4572_77]
MKTTIFTVVLLILATITACSGGYTKWEKDVIIKGATLNSTQDVEFTKIRYSIKDGDTNAIVGYLKNDAVINSFPIKTGWVHFDKGWDLELFCLAENAEVYSVKAIKDAWVLKGRTDKIILVLPEDMEVQGMPCKGGGGPKGIHTSFYRTGELRSFFASEEVEIDGVYCKSTVFTNVVLYKNGKLKSAKLSRPYVYETGEIKKGKKIKFDENGNLMKK